MTAEFFDNKTILLTGGSGSWGNELVKQVLAKYNPKQIRIYSRGEHKQVDMKRRFPNEKRLKYIIGDVRDKQRLQTAMKGVHFVFHLAALKHVPVCEENPWESVQTNIIGTQNVIDTAIENNVEKVIDISTDKAVDPFNLYGTCKAVGEKLMIAANLVETQTRFVCIRGGNVLGTNGSVVPLFREQILRAGEVTITDENMTRYMMDLTQAINLIFEATTTSVGGEIFVMRMPALKVTDLAAVMIEELGSFRKDTAPVRMRTIGIRPGEKLHEVLVSRYEAKNSVEQGDYFVILPNIGLPNLEKYKDLPRVTLQEFNSTNAEQLTHEQIKTMLKEEGWLKPAEHSNLSSDELTHYAEREGWKPRK
ncbi:MAG: polysaccharide biosynthesis protein [Candidatus Woesearchaeota archaeon]|nr:polysaccharide biosynthesis protein [Candidatus Woesearchaeota archaeon]